MTAPIPPASASPAARQAAPRPSAAGAGEPVPFTRSSAPDAAGTRRDERARGSLGSAAMQRALAPLTSGETREAQRLARSLAPTRSAPRGFDSTIPTHAVGPYSGNRYTFTCCPVDRGQQGSKPFTLDDMLDDAFRTGTKTTISLTSEGDGRHSDYYKKSQTTPSGKYTIASYGTPEFTTAVDQHGRPATASIFYNAVRDNSTGRTEHMKMVHVNGWPDQTALDAKNELKLASYIGDKLDAGDLKNVLIHCTEGRNRTGSWATHLEMMSAVSKGIAPDAKGVVDWMRRARVPDAIFVPEQLAAVAENKVRLSRLSSPQGGQRAGR